MTLKVFEKYVEGFARGANLYQKVDFLYFRGRIPPAPIEVKFFTAKRTHVPVGQAKFHVNGTTSRPCGAKNLIFRL